MSHVAYLANDNLLVVDGLKKRSDNTYVNSADIIVTVKDTAGVEVSGANWPMPFLYIDGTNGKYECILPNGLDLDEGVDYIAEITATETTIQAFWKLRFKAKQRIDE